jgi:hypothetical protein
MNRPFLTLSTRDFLTGVAPSAHSEKGGLWHVLQGVTPAYDPGGSGSVEPGLLQASPAATDLTGAVVVDEIFASAVGYESTTPYLYMLGDSGHFYRNGLASTPTDLRSATPITDPANGIFIYKPQGGTKYLYYMQKTQMGRWDMSGSHPTGWTDNHNTGWNSTAIHPVHRLFDVVYIANGSQIGSLRDDGAASVTITKNNLDLPDTLRAVALCDDGLNLVIAATENINATDNFADNRILFWDGYSSSWQREYKITDRFIWAVKNIGGVVYAFGQFGVYELSYNSIPRKVVSRSIGFANSSNFGLGYGSNRVGLYNQNAVLWGQAASIDSYGKLAEDIPIAYLRPFLDSTINELTFIETQFEAGYIYFGTQNAKLYRVNLSSATHNSGTAYRAETVYIPLNTQYNIRAIELVFGEPLASGDSIEIDLQSDNDTSEVVWNTWSFTADGAIRRKRKTAALGVKFTSDLIKIKFRFTGGAVKVKKIELYGDPITS